MVPINQGQTTEILNIVRHCRLLSAHFRITPGPINCMGPTIHNNLPERYRHHQTCMKITPLPQ